MVFQDELESTRFQERIRLRLAAINRSQADLARDHGMSPQSLSQMIKSFPNTTYRSLEKLAEMLTVKVSWLIDGDPKDAIASRDDVLPDASEGI